MKIDFENILKQLGEEMQDIVYRYEVCETEDSDKVICEDNLTYVSLDLEYLSSIISLDLFTLKNKIEMLEDNNYIKIKKHNNNNYIALCEKGIDIAFSIEDIGHITGQNEEL